MIDRQEQIRRFIEYSIQTVNPYTDAKRNLYRIGFLEAYLASIFVNDPLLFQSFKNKIEGLKNEGK